MSQGTTGGGVVFTPTQELEQTAHGELLTGHIVPHASWRMDYTVNPALYTATTANGGTATVDANRLALTTTSNTAGSAYIVTRKRVKYVPGIGAIGRFSAVFATGTASSQQLIGVGDQSDGFFFGYNGTSFGIMRRRAGVDNWTASGAWNGSALTMTLNQQLGNIYQIRYQWLGFGTVRFYIYDATLRSFVLVHTIDYANTSVDVHTLNPTFPIFAEIKNTGNNTSLSMYSASGLVGLEGGPYGLKTLAVPRSAVAAATLSDANNNHILSVTNTTLIASTTNRISINPGRIIVSRENNSVKSSVFRVYLNATTTGTRTYTEVDASHSPVQTSTTTTTISGGTVLYTVSLSAGSSPFTWLFGDELVLYPGDTVSVSCQDSSATVTDVSVSIDYYEDF